MSNRRLARSITHAALRAGGAAADSAVTIAARMPVFAGCLVSPNAAAMREIEGAVSEKMTAGWEGAIAAGFAWQQLMLKSAFNIPTPAAFANDLVRVLGKGSHPAQKRVKANAARLSKRG